MRIVMTGATGYIGQPLVRALVDRGHDVTAVVRSDESARLATGLGATPVRGTLADVDVLRTAAGQADAAIHLAMATSDTAAADLGAATALQDGLRGGRYVHTGGVWVYGDTDGVVDEDAPLAPPAVTSWRLDNERQVLAHDGHPVVVMPGLVYGDQGGIIEACYAAPARESGSVMRIGSGRNHWTLVHREDIADLYVRAVEQAPAKAVYAGVLDLAVTAGEVAEALAARIGHPGAVHEVDLDTARQQFGPLADALLLDQRLTSGKARAQLGWQPKHTDPLAELAKP